MKEINLREYYPFYNMDVYLEVSDEIAGQLDRFKLDEEAHRVRILRAKAYFSLDRGDGIEKDALQKPPQPLELILKAGGKVEAVVAKDADEFFGVNSRVQLAEAAKIMKHRINRKHMESGVTLVDPENTYIGSDVKIGMDTVILPGCVLEGNTEIGEDCEIGPNSRLTDTKLGNGVKFQTSTAIESEIGNETTVGPFAYIRPNCHIGKKVGDFVEVKNSTIGDGTKIPHLSYVGDTDAGEKINFGCGSIMVNYDGKKKHRTTIEDNVFVGCNVNLVAPVTVKKGSYIAAGSTITKDVPEDVLAVARARQQVIEGWTKKRIER